MKKTGFYLTLILLCVLNFSLQSFDIQKLNFQDCNFYLYDPECSSVSSYVFNKTIRMIVNLFAIFYFLNHFKIFNSKTIIGLIISFIVLASFDMFFSFSALPFLVQLHKTLNPLLYSPLILIVLVSSQTLLNQPKIK